MKKKIESFCDYYRYKYGVVPVFKAGMNCGTVPVAEIGELNKQIAYHGDVINPASRIQLSKTKKAINDKYCGYVEQGKGL